MSPLIFLLNKTKIKKSIACTIGLVLVCEILYPIQSYALTTGPSQPEVQSFEPVGTTDMVDIFTGDFLYNIPLLDVDGYPINLAYHGAGDMEQEASWVGLGWNINPGVINRSVRGIPDDFNGETIQKTINLKDEENLRVGLGAGVELFGIGDPVKLGIDNGFALNMNNYRGMSADLTLGVGIHLFQFASIGINIGVNSQNGADVDYSLGLGFSSKSVINSDIGLNIGASFNHGYNTRSGLKDKTWGGSVSLNRQYNNVRMSGSKTVPIALRNYVPVVTNRSTLHAYKGQIKVGAEGFWSNAYGSISGLYSILKYDTDGTRKSYGYMFLQNAEDNSILDFTRDKDGMFNETMNFLPPSALTYDVYSVSGQGTGGGFRPFRNDFGSVYDPLTQSENKDRSVNLEASIGGYFGLGADVSWTKTHISSGPWMPYKKSFQKNKMGSLFENVYFKKAGEITTTYEPLDKTPIDGKASSGLSNVKNSMYKKRQPRGVLMYYFTSMEASKPGVATSTKIRSYTSTNGFEAGPSTPYVEYNRISAFRKADHISEIVQTEKDGSRYVYSIPAMNISTSEMTFAIGASSNTSGLVEYTTTDASVNNSHGRDNFFTNTQTPPYAHSYLLTSVLSVDYVDVTGDGPTDDDFGQYTKFNYSLKDSLYSWKSPYGSNLAQYNPGFKSDPLDDKASVIVGTREQWYLHSIETKNNIAEFYVSPRQDGKGVNEVNDNSYKLDSIRLYNKHDRFINGVNAIPIKTVIFSYSYELCKNTPNSTAPENGKLTLKKVFFKYGNSDKGLLSPYEFKYTSNYNYNYANKDRWGVYKPQASGIPNSDFPFVNQLDPNNDSYVAAWALDEIYLPSGGKIKVEYESDDYAYVQDKLAMEMFMLKGLGTSPTFQASNQLFINKKNPHNYFYFKRHKERENPSLSPKDNYLKESDILYYNFDVKLVSNTYENIKGFAEVEEVGYCSDNEHGYIKTKTVKPTNSKSHLSHPTYTAINFSRYYLPHIVYPGANPELSNIENILAGLKGAFLELINIFKNPVDVLVDRSIGKDVKLNSSYVRLNSPDRKKKGGGLRVKKLLFEDNWAELTGAEVSNAVYGKEYTYTTTTDNGTEISSGVASYEPQIGGDENPLRLPDKYIAQKGSNFPPNDPVGLFNEMPIGESLYPPPVVGYSKVTISSIHKEYAYSAQSQDIYEYYTAKEFPIEVKHTQINKVDIPPKFSFIKQKHVYEASQGFTFVFNDMHGKMKRTETRILKPGSESYDVISYNDYNYFANNNIPVIEYDEETGNMKKVLKTMAVESDMSIDTRQKLEHSRTSTLYMNLNVSPIGVPPTPLAIPLAYPFIYRFENEFYSVTTTKMIQRYGILESIKTFNEGAVTIVKNEAFDPVTGEALITSVNNEYHDLEYTVNYPAYWAYESMGPSYDNVNYANSYEELNIDNHKILLSLLIEKNLKIGDELLMTYEEGGIEKTNNIWVTGILNLDSVRIYNRYYHCIPCGDTIVGNNSLPEISAPDTMVIVHNCEDSTPSYYDNFANATPNSFYILQPRFKYSWPNSATITKVRIKVVRSGSKNQLNETIQNYIGMSEPFDGENYLKNNLDKLISISAKLYSDTNYTVLPQFDSTINPTTWDSMNIYVSGTRGIKRVSEEYAYLKRRDYRGYSRVDGLFDAVSLWKSGFEGNTYMYCFDGVSKGFRYKSSILTSMASVSGYKYMIPDLVTDLNWVKARHVNKITPWGHEIENTDAVGNVTAAVFGYQNLIPLAISHNAKSNEFLHEGFEDYRMLNVIGAKNKFYFSPFMSLFEKEEFSSNLEWFDLNGLYGVKLNSTHRHTGMYSLETSSTSVSVNIPIINLSEIIRTQLRPFELVKSKKYIVSFWIKDKSSSGSTTSYSPPSGFVTKSNIIDGWQLVEKVITVPPSGSVYALELPTNKYIDDIRITPYDANMKSFVYDPVSGKLIAGLDENNFATFYEYDKDGSLIRTKKETEKGVMTITESRSSTTKNQ